MPTLRWDDPVAVALVGAIRAGDVESLRRLLHEQPGLTATRLADDRGGLRTPLHVAADWPATSPTDRPSSPR